MAILGQIDQKGSFEGPTNPGSASGGCILIKPYLDWVVLVPYRLEGGGEGDSCISFICSSVITKRGVVIYESNESMSPLFNLRVNCNASFSK